MAIEPKLACVVSPGQSISCLSLVGVVDVFRCPGGTSFPSLVSVEGPYNVVRSYKVLAGGLIVLGEVCQKVSKYLLRGFDLKEVSREDTLLGILLGTGELK